MEKSQQLNTRQSWVDIVKIFACVLVALGHFFQSMVSSELIPNSHLYQWFNSTIYYFHVPLFFICSGYLFQKGAKERSFSQWKMTVLKKLLALGIPYFIFSIATWLLKTVFSASVNGKAEGFFKTLFVEPFSPYWYLYALFFVFCVTFTMRSKRDAVGALLASLLLKVISFVYVPEIKVIQYIVDNEIWFVLGMLLCYFDLPARLQKSKAWLGVAFSALFLVTSVAVYLTIGWNAIVAFVMGVFGCASTLLVAFGIRTSHRCMVNISKYTFPVFLMHTIFAASLRSLLFKVGISNSAIHIILGLIISFVGPILAAKVMEKLKYPEFLLYPNKFIKIGTKNHVKKA